VQSLLKKFKRRSTFSCYEAVSSITRSQAHLVRCRTGKISQSPFQDPVRAEWWQRSLLPQ